MTAALPIEDRVGLAPADHAALTRALVGVHTLGDLVQRGGRVTDVVIQDEFTHDVVVAHADAIYLVFDST